MLLLSEVMNTFLFLLGQVGKSASRSSADQESAVTLGSVWPCCVSTRLRCAEIRLFTMQAAQSSLTNLPFLIYFTFAYLNFVPLPSHIDVLTALQEQTQQFFIFAGKK